MVHVSMIHLLLGDLIANNVYMGSPGSASFWKRGISS